MTILASLSPISDHFIVYSRWSGVIWWTASRTTKGTQIPEGSTWIEWMVMQGSSNLTQTCGWKFLEDKGHH